jgi:hypothetical protein
MASRARRSGIGASRRLTRSTLAASEGCGVSFVASAARDWRTVDPRATLVDSAHRTILHIDEAPVAGMVWGPGSMLRIGEIEVDIWVRDVFQKSLPGIAFRCATDGAKEVV